MYKKRKQKFLFLFAQSLDEWLFFFTAYEITIPFLKTIFCLSVMMLLSHAYA